MILRATCRPVLCNPMSLSRLGRALVSSQSAAHQMLSTPTWSTASLLESDAHQDQDTPSNAITPAQLHHLLRLAALPLPKSPDDQGKMLDTLRHQLLFVHAVQRVDAAGVEPLAAIRDETAQGLGEATIGLDHVQPALDAEIPRGHYRRPRRPRHDSNTGPKAQVDEEKWDPLALASKRVGKYFVVESAQRQ
ncbi:hypothetical protein CDD82_4345 [Ophiocordyceps australis]|uniref:Glutamyl-tRNA amidotransferase complex subunit Gta3 domain-containing protein n=1 Tax=Ophiocordyceps australis TaxID=1399860 RepID=A0A2C5ZU85_9HYPO|nr:hypothetical protein CDD82_4345 [Ophiocordyceps australis]